MLSTQELEGIMWVKTPTIREAIEDDAEMLLEYFKVLAAEPVNNTGVRSTVFQETVDEQRRLIRWYAQAPNSKMFILDGGNKIAGMIKLMGSDHPMSAHVVELSLNIHPHYRGAGFGTKLMRHTLNWVRSQKGIRRVQLELATRNEGAFHLYRRFGFQLEGLRYMGYYLFDEAGGHFTDVYVMALLL